MPGNCHLAVEGGDADDISGIRDCGRNENNIFDPTASINNGYIHCGQIADA